MPREWTPPKEGEKLHINIHAIQRNVEEAAGILRFPSSADFRQEADNRLLSRMLLGDKDEPKL